jgi:GT2 family glycosyltransferase
MSDSRVTVAVVPRERFSYTKPSLESIFANTPPGVKLVYVDGGSPPAIRRYLAAQARSRGFDLIRTDHYLSPNQARNRAIARVTTKYVVFVDNDVLVEPGWLEALVDCAEETGASVVGPACFAGPPGTRSIHMAGGIAHIQEKNGRRVLHERHNFAGKDFNAMASQLQRGPTELAEFHTMLVRKDVFDRFGPLDEKLLSALEHVDLCMTVREAGGTVYFEPKSAMTYVPPPPFALSDYPFFMLRWSDAWNIATVRHFQQKWQLAAEDESLQEITEWLRIHRHIYFKPAWKIIYPVVGWRRTNTIERALSQCVVSLVS